MKDISRVCGVSVATVSKALNDHKDVGEETKRHIRQVAREMGYFPNSAARALKTNRTYSIGVLFADDAGSGLTHDYFAGVLDSLKRMAEKCGYDITFINSSRNRAGSMSYLAHSRYRGFDGVVIACTDFTDPEVTELLQSDIPVVTIDYVSNDHIAVISDNVSGMRDLMEYICRKGHRKIAYIHGANTGSSSTVTNNRLSCFYRTAEQFDVEIPDTYVREAAFRDTEKTYQVTDELLDLPDPPTCIIYPDDFAAFGGIKAIRERGLRIPEDVSVAGYDGIRAARNWDPELTTVHQDTEQIGFVAARELISLIERPKASIIQQITIPGRLIEGRSVAAIGDREGDGRPAGSHA